MNLYFSDWTGELYPKNEEIQWFSNQDLKRLAFPAPILKILSEKYEMKIRLFEIMKTYNITLKGFIEKIMKNNNIKNFILINTS